MNHLYPEPAVATGDDLAPRTAVPGDLRRPMVVLLHASGVSSHQWSALAQRLSPAFDVHACDLHGHGGQDPWRGPRPVSVRDEAALVLPGIERAGGAHLIGHSTTTMNTLLEDKIILVTGGSSGIGRATARALARAGASVVIADIDISGGHGAEVADTVVRLFCDATSFITGHALPIDGGLLAQ